MINNAKIKEFINRFISENYKKKKRHRSINLIKPESVDPIIKTPTPVSLPEPTTVPEPELISAPVKEKIKVTVPKRTKAVLPVPVSEDLPESKEEIEKFDRKRYSKIKNAFKKSYFGSYNYAKRNKKVEGERETETIIVPIKKAVNDVDYSFKKSTEKIKPNRQKEVHNVFKTQGKNKDLFNNSFFGKHYTNKTDKD